MQAWRKLSWWIWLAIFASLSYGLAGRSGGIHTAIALTALHGVIGVKRSGRIFAFPVQVRAGYLAMLVAGLWEPLSFLYWLLFVGLDISVAYDYCFLARMLSLLPVNRRENLSWTLVWRTFLKPPTKGSFVHAAPVT